MGEKLKWTVQKAPTGPYRSFFRRGWPSATIAGKTAISLWCEDDYVPADVKLGRHGEITIRVAKYTPGNPSFTWRVLKARAATLNDAKAKAQEFVDSNPNFFCLPEA